MLIKIYTGGSCNTNPGKGGCAAIIYNGSQCSIYSETYRRTTSPRMELAAVILGLRSIDNPSDILVRTDSTYVRDCIDMLPRVSKNGWIGARKTRLANTDLLEQCYYLVCWHKRVRIHWIRTKSTGGNLLADKVAKEAARSKRRVMIDNEYEHKEKADRKDTKTSSRKSRGMVSNRRMSMHNNKKSTKNKVRKS